MAVQILVCERPGFMAKVEIDVDIHVLSAVLV
jgi:hypothetical protein